jgi:hypothetical protein
LLVARRPLALPVRAGSVGVLATDAAVTDFFAHTVANSCPVCRVFVLDVKSVAHVSEKLA